MASAATLKLFVTTPRGVDLQVEAESVSAPSAQGELSILPGHRPLIAAVAPGVLRFRSEGNETLSAIGAGFLEVESDSIRIVAQSLQTLEGARSTDVAALTGEAESKLAAFEGYREGPEFDQLENDARFAAAQRDLINLSDRLAN